MDPAYVYEVRIAIDDASAFDAFVAWLLERHVDDVCALGRCSAEVVVIDRAAVSASAAQPPREVKATYRFASRAAFEAYERDHAPKLRADGIAELAKHGLAPGRGATFARATGAVVALRGDQAASRARAK